MEYFAAAPHRADYTKQVGVLLGAEPLDIVEAFQQARPKGVKTRVPAGTGQVLIEFTMPKSADPAKLFAAPVGYRDASGYNFFTDDMFFYDDPHKLWNWSAQTWRAIDAHQVIAGMNQRQVSLSLGAIAKQSSGQYGDGEMVYANAGHPVAVSFTKGKVTASHPAQSF
jgi:ABC-type branched-subunit amino acid transport system substrate-binding protein